MNDINMSKYNRYIEEFKKYFPNSSIADKSYDITLIRSLIIYFLYKEEGASMKKITDLLGVTRTAGVKANQRVRDYFNNKQLYTENKSKHYMLFKRFFYRYTKIYNIKI